MDSVILEWGSSFELAILSAMESPDSVRSIIIHERPSDHEKALDKRRYFFVPWGMYNYDEIPKSYFNFTDTSKYVVLEQLP